MPNPIIKVVVQAPKDNNWIITLVVTVGVVIAGWIVSYIIEMKKLRIDIEVKAVEEAINLLNERSKAITNINSSLVWLYSALNTGELKDMATEDIHLRLLNKYKDAVKSSSEDRFSTYFESREIIFYDFKDKFNKLQEFRLNISDKCILLYKDLVQNYFPRDTYFKPSQVDTQKLMKKLETVIRYLAKTNNFIDNLKISLQNEFLSGFFKNRKIPEIPFHDDFEMLDLSIPSKEKKNVE